MKVLHINCNYLYTALHQNMIRKLEREDLNNTVFVPMSNLKNSRIKADKEKVIAVECFNKFDRLSFYYKQHKIFNSLKRNVTISEFDIVHAYTLFTDGNIAYEINRLYGIPYVVAVRNTDVNAFFKYRKYFYCYVNNTTNHYQGTYYIDSNEWAFSTGYYRSEGICE